jgi:uncharacterized protein
MSPAIPSGRFVWYELLTTDPTAAERFYTGVLGWGTQKWPPRNYTMWTNHGQPVGGLMALSEAARQAGAPPHWMPFVSTPDVDGTAEQARKLGARVLVPPTDTPGVGRWAVLADPQGTPFTAYTPAGGPPADPRPPRIGEFSWHELMTSVDADTAFRFYQTLFGWEKTGEEDMGPVGKYLLYGVGGHPLGGMFRMTGGPPPLFWLYVRIEDVDGAAVRVKERGGQVMNGPMDVPGGDRIVQISDPQGAVFALHQTARP